MLNSACTDIRSKLRQFICRHHLIIFLLFSLAILLLRVDSVGYFKANFLWVEDGNIFINQARSLGIASLWKPYNGYLHLYLRMLAYLSSIVDLRFTPFFILVGWFSSFFALMTVLFQRGRALGFSIITLLILVVLIILQPSFTGVLINLTNSQWLLGTAFILYFMTDLDTVFSLSVSKFVLLFVVCLTGPFAMVLSPVFAFRLFLLKDFNRHYWVYFTVVLCAVIQFIILLHSDRFHAGAIDLHILHWLGAFCAFLFFSVSRPLAFLASIIFWLSIMASVIPYRLTKKQAYVSILLLLSTLVLILTTLYLWKSNPTAALNINYVNRYCWIPYTLLVFFAFIVTETRLILRTIVIVCMAVICVVEFRWIAYQELNFYSFARFAKYKEVIIPINPIGPTFPDWFIKGVPASNEALNTTERQSLALGNMVLSDGQLTLGANGLKVLPFSKGATLTFNHKIQCNKASDIAVEIILSSVDGGWIQVETSANEVFSTPASIWRWYPAGEQLAQFAFPYLHKGLYMQFDLGDFTRAVTIKQITAYCLP